MMDVKDLVATLGCDVRMQPSDFWCLGSKAEQAEFESHKDKRALPVDLVDAEDINWRSIMTPQTLKRHQDYLDYIKQRIDSGSNDPDDVFMYDIDVNCNGHRKFAVESKVSPSTCKLMCLTSHGTIWHSQFDRPLLTHEWLNIHGFPSLAEFQAPYKLPVDFENMMRRGALTHNHVKSMVGLGWHAPSMGAYVFFTLASLELWSDFQGIPPKVMIVTIDSDDDDDLKEVSGEASDIEPLEPEAKRFRFHLKASVDPYDLNVAPYDSV